ncbi:MAG: YiiD C-terminal domain-containing protein [Burkholderiales bacterium]|nr:YiiD C-terminal domain-containing protein [Burkholderiales bacterium]
MSQGFLSRFTFGAGGMRRLLNLWPPFRAAGIRVREIAPDFRSATVELRMRLFNRNYVGTHFGGSLFAMTDPFFMIMMMKNLGPQYLVWDKEGTVRFLKPARGTVVARFQLPEESIAKARAATESGERHEPKFRVEIVDSDGVTVADVEKTLYIRKKKVQWNSSTGS